MNTLKSLTRMARLALPFAAGLALIAGVDMANAKSTGNQTSSHIAVLKVGKDHHKTNDKKESRRERKRKKYAEKKQKKDCRVIISGTGTSPCGGKTAGNPSKPGGTTTGSTPPKNPPGMVTISNGTKTVTVPDVPGQFYAAATNQGGINVHVGNDTIFMPGNSVTIVGEAMSTARAQQGGLQETVTSKAGAGVNEVGVTLTVAPSTPTPVPAPTGPAGNGGGGLGTITQE